MEFVFWQNMISIHQQAFLEALAGQADVDGVLLAVENEISEDRKKMGWDVPEIKGVTIVTAPQSDEIIKIVSEHKDAVHVMGGIKVGEMITAAFDECVKQKCRIGIMTEPYDAAGVKGLLRGVKYKLYSKHFKDIDFVLAIGQESVVQYKALGFDEKRLFPWAYFITPAAHERRNEKTEQPRIMYAGRLEEPKGILRFVQVFLETAVEEYYFDIYGEGSHEEKIVKLVNAAGVADRFCFTGYLAYNELLEKYRQYDWIVLPSTQKDGWGVVVSEGLMNGLKVICSKKCGASQVVQQGVNGVTFDWGEAEGCRNAIRKIFGGDSFADAATIAEWASDTLTGAAGAEYFMRIMQCVYNNNEKPAVPWAKKI